MPEYKVDPITGRYLEGPTIGLTKALADRIDSEWEETFPKSEVNNMVMKPRVYFASCVQHATKWETIRAHSPGVEVVSSWHSSFDPAKDTPEFAREFWAQDHREVEQAQWLICYCREGDTLRGAMIEMGIALGNHIPVILVGECASLRTWQCHPGVIQRKQLTEALAIVLGHKQVFITWP